MTKTYCDVCGKEITFKYHTATSKGDACSLEHAKMLEPVPA